MASVRRKSGRMLLLLLLDMTLCDSRVKSTLDFSSRARVGRSGDSSVEL